MNRLQEMYDSEISFNIEALWDSGFIAKLGDDYNGYKLKAFNTLNDAVHWLTTQALIDYPDSDYAKELMS